MFWDTEEKRVYKSFPPVSYDQVQTVKFYTNQLVREQNAIKYPGGRTEIPDIVAGHFLYPNNGKRPLSLGGGVRTIIFQGYDRPVEFYSPDYSSGALPGSADLRRTLYWNPNVKTDKNGKASVSFYNNSTCKHIHISAEGITKEGEPVVYENK